MARNNKKLGVTFVWSIENIDVDWESKVVSPVFLSNSLNDSEWQITLYPNIGCVDNYMSLSLTRCGNDDKGMERIIVDCELSFLDENGATKLESTVKKNHGFVRGYTFMCKKFVLRDEVFDSRRKDFLSLEILTVRCRLRRRFNENTLAEIRFSRTIIDRSILMWTIKDFCNLKTYHRPTIHLKKSNSQDSILTFELVSGIGDQVEIEITATEPIALQFLGIITVLDATGKDFEYEIGRHSFELRMEDWCYLTNAFRPQMWRFPSFIKKSCLLKNKSLYLPMGILSLRVECFFYINNASVNENLRNFQVAENQPNAPKCDKQCMTEPELNVPIPPNISKFEDEAGAARLTITQKCDKQCMTEPDSTIPELSTLEQNNHGSQPNPLQTTFTHDIQGLFEEGLLSDFTLHSSNKPFHVHKNILSARSPVFRAMFTTSMKEREGNSIEIPDVDPDTLHRLLMFVYSDKVEEEDLTWEAAMDLYFAADKYAIDDLRRASGSILKSGLCASNACQLLIHADLRGDQDLGSTAKDFIIEHDKDIIGSVEWKALQKNNIQLVVEILSCLYVKKSNN